MPTYDYECEKCGHEFEAFQSMKEPAIEDCPECKAKKSVRRLIGCGAGIIFKGSGFYETDYKRKSPSGSNSGSSVSSENKSSSASKTNGSSKTNGKAKSSAESA